MALLSHYIDEKKFDVRMVGRALTKGLMLQEEVDKNLKKLSDDSTNADYVDPSTIVDTDSEKA